MHRSGSTSRASDEFVINVSPQKKGSPGMKLAEMDQLPTYDPLSEVSKKASSRLKSAENAVHLLPVVVVLCYIVLWFFSHEVDLAKRGALVAATNEVLELDDYAHWNDTSLLDIGRELGIVQRAVAGEAARSSGMAATNKVLKHDDYANWNDTNMLDIGTVADEPKRTKEMSR